LYCTPCPRGGRDAQLHSKHDHERAHTPAPPEPTTTCEFTTRPSTVNPQPLEPRYRVPYTAPLARPWPTRLPTGLGVPRSSTSHPQRPKPSPNGIRPAPQFGTGLTDLPHRFRPISGLPSRLCICTFGPAVRVVPPPTRALPCRSPLDASAPLATTPGLGMITSRECATGAAVVTETLAHAAAPPVVGGRDSGDPFELTLLEPQLLAVIELHLERATRLVVFD
jgi:hypothetical protein